MTIENRLLDVNARTTFDFVDVRTSGSDWADEGVAVLDVATDEDAPGTVFLRLEMDPADADSVDHHVDSVRLSPGQARVLAAELEDAAATAGDATANDADSAR